MYCILQQSFEKGQALFFKSSKIVKMLDKINKINFTYFAFTFFKTTAKFLSLFNHVKKAVACLVKLLKGGGPFGLHGLKVSFLFYILLLS